ncbi:phosphopantetheine-binding protein [Frankia tisae]|uniref:phosphopantetheine-binding protein n=1 Tax=Frankia tisae TaxID=2950104 RepID=UPI0021BEFBFD|nr:phosphopantetheine-binding protein [Frankia tisae]
MRSDGIREDAHSTEHLPFRADGDELADLIREFLRQPVNFGEDDNLLALGLESVGLMTIAARLRARGVDLPFSALIEDPTLRRWRLLAGGQPPADQTATDRPDGNADTEAGATR